MGTYINNILTIIIDYNVQYSLDIIIFDYKYHMIYYNSIVYYMPKPSHLFIRYLYGIIIIKNMYKQNINPLKYTDVFIL